MDLKLLEVGKRLHELAMRLSANPNVVVFNKLLDIGFLKCLQSVRRNAG